MSTTAITTAAVTDPVLAEHVAAIRALRGRIVSDVAEIGRRLAAVKERVGHGNWLPLLDREFGWTDQTARNFIRAHEFVESIPNSKRVLILGLPVSSVYLLAAPSTPPEARDEIIARAESGAVMTTSEVKEIVAEHKAADEDDDDDDIDDEERKPPAHYQILEDGTQKKITWEEFNALPPKPPPTGPSWRVEVTDASGKVWSSGVRVRTKEEASRYMGNALDEFISADAPIVEMRTLKSSDAPNVNYLRSSSGRYKGRYSYRLLFNEGTCGNFVWQEGNDAPAIYAEAADAASPAALAIPTAVGANSALGNDIPAQSSAEKRKTEMAALADSDGSCHGAQS